VRFADRRAPAIAACGLKGDADYAATEPGECGLWQAAEPTALQSLNPQPPQIELRDRGAIEAIADF
jgi:hypothetical protein